MSLINQAHATGTDHVFNAGAVGITIMAIAGWLPAFAALLACVWYLLQIWESPTVRNWRGFR